MEYHCCQQLYSKNLPKTDGYHRIEKIEICERFYKIFKKNLRMSSLITPWRDSAKGRERHCLCILSFRDAFCIIRG